MKDKYDEAVEYLTEHPDAIDNAWDHCLEHPAGCLFLFCAKDMKRRALEDGGYCGCLTQIRSSHSIPYRAQTESLTLAILADDRIPAREPNESDVDILPVFAEWQRRIDKELGRA